jgi:hypothetical protein
VQLGGVVVAAGVELVVLVVLTVVEVEKVVEVEARMVVLLVVLIAEVVSTGGSEAPVKKRLAHAGKFAQRE